MLEKIEKALIDTDKWIRDSKSLSGSYCVSYHQLELLSAYLELLTLWSSRVDLVAPASPQQLIERHLVDCYAAYLLINKQVGLMESCLDVGSGAGLPGVVFAILETQSVFYLCEQGRSDSSFCRGEGRLESD
jgi:16S rRNA (guanine527-N7)-methyltransferase